MSNNTITLKREDLEALVRYCYDLEAGTQGVRQREKLCEEIQDMYQAICFEEMEFEQFRDRDTPPILHCVTLDFDQENED